MRLIADDDRTRIEHAYEQATIALCADTSAQVRASALFAVRRSLEVVLTNIEELGKERPYQTPLIAAEPVPPFDPSRR